MYGISTDDVVSHQKFRAELGIPFPLLADVGGVVSKQYDSAMEHEGQVYSARKIVIVDKAGTVVYRDDAFEVGSAQDFDAMIAAIPAD